jgi:hypothetical protein
MQVFFARARINLWGKRDVFSLWGKGCEEKSPSAGAPVAGISHCDRWAFSLWRLTKNRIDGNWSYVESLAV